MIKEGKINYLNNGRIPSNKPVISTTFKRRTEEYSNNGRIPKNLEIYVTKLNNENKKSQELEQLHTKKQFNKEFDAVVNNENKINENIDEEKPKVLSWVIDTLNPLNHLPVISTIKKLSSKTNDTLDIVQSAVGGAIYGGGPIGLVKGIGSWFIDKIIPESFFASNKQKIGENNIIKKVSRSKIKENIEKQDNTKTTPISLLPDIKSKSESEKISTKTNKNNNFINFYKKKEKPVENKIDINA